MNQSFVVDPAESNPSFISTFITISSSSSSSSDESITFQGNHNSKDDDPDAIIIGNNPITLKHFNILENEEWFNDEIINSYFYILQREFEENLYLSTFFYPKLQRENENINWLIKSGISKKIKSSKYIFIPININQVHWVLVMVNMKTEEGGPMIQYYDSMLNKKIGKNILKFIGNKFEKLLINENEKLLINENLNLNENDDSIIKMMKSLSIDSDKKNEKNENGNNGKKKNEKNNEKKNENFINSNCLFREIPNKQPQQTNNSSCGSFVCYWTFLKSNINKKGNGNQNEKNENDIENNGNSRDSKNNENNNQIKSFSQSDALNHNKIIMEKFKNYNLE